MNITKRSICFAASALFAIIAFFLVFAPAIKVYGILDMGWIDAYFGDSEAALKGAYIPFVGFILILGAAAILTLNAVKLILGKEVSDGTARKAAIISIALLFIGALLVFLTTVFFFAFNNAPADVKPMFKLGAGPITAGVFALIAAAGAGVGGFIFKD